MKKIFATFLSLFFSGAALHAEEVEFHFEIHPVSNNSSTANPYLQSTIDYTIPAALVPEFTEIIQSTFDAASTWQNPSTAFQNISDIDADKTLHPNVTIVKDTVTTIAGAGGLSVSISPSVADVGGVGYTFDVSVDPGYYYLLSYAMGGLANANSEVTYVVTNPGSSGVNGVFVELQFSCPNTAGQTIVNPAFVTTEGAPIDVNLITGPRFLDEDTGQETRRCRAIFIISALEASGSLTFDLDDDTNNRTSYSVRFSLGVVVGNSVGTVIGNSVGTVIGNSADSGGGSCGSIHGTKNNSVELGMLFLLLFAVFQSVRRFSFGDKT